MSAAGAQSVHLKVPLTLVDGGLHSSTIYFGVDPSATYCIDPALGEFELPADRCGTEPLCVYFTDTRTDSGACMGNGLLLDLRAYTSPAQADTYAVSFTAQQYPLVFRWPANLAGYYDTLRMKDAVTGLLYHADMLSVDSLVISSSNVQKLLIYAQGPKGYLDHVDEAPAGLPDRPMLSQNYPNPFNPETRIRYTLTRRTGVSLRVYDLLGRVVAVLVESEQPRGEYVVSWRPGGLPAGVYFYRLMTSSDSETKTMFYLR